MNGVKEEDNIQFTQSAKGVWYCIKLSLHNENLNEAIVDADNTMTTIEKILKKHNGGE